MLFNEPSWINIEPRNHLVFETLLSFLDRASADPANVQQLADTTVTILRSISTKNPSVDQYRFESRVLFGILFTVVKQIDVTSAQQDHLIKLVLSLRHMPLPATVAQEIDPRRDLDSNMNEELNKLINVLSDFEREAPLHPHLENRPNYTHRSREHPPWRQRCLTAGEWVNINAFIARLHTSAPDLTKLDLRGLFAMIEALELPLTSSQLDDVLPAAACWIIYAGNELRNNDIPYAYYDDDGGTKRSPWSKSELWNGPHAFNQARWEFWMQRFKDIAERGDVSNTVRLAAWHALEAGS
jgi:hypothetical protein